MSDSEETSVAEEQEPQEPMEGGPPFQPSKGHVIAGIVEQSGYIPGWIVLAIIIAILLSLFCWIPNPY